MIITIFFAAALAFAQGSKPTDFNSGLNLISTAGSPTEYVYQRTFTENSELFLVTKDLRSKILSFSFGSVKKDFAPCEGSNYGYGSLSKNNSFLAVSCEDYSIELWDLSKIKRLWRYEFNREKNSGDVWGFVTNDGRRLVLTDLLKIETAQLWDIEREKKVKNLIAQTSDCRCVKTISRVVLSPDQKMVAVAYRAIVHLWNLEDGNLLDHFIDDEEKLFGKAVLSHKYLVEAMLFTKDSKTLVTAGGDGITKAWDISSGKLIRTFRQHSNYRIVSIDLSQDERKLVTSSGRNEFRVWDFQSGSLLWKSSDLKKPVELVMFSPDGKRIMSQTTNKLSIWNAETGELLEQAPIEKNSLVRFSKDWRFVEKFELKSRTSRLYEYSQ